MVLHARLMWDCEPTLVWRVKLNGKWMYKRARWMIQRDHTIVVEPPQLPPPESVESGDESE